MRSEQHYDDEVLVSFLDAPAAVEHDAHLSSCETCRVSLDAYRDLTQVLADGAVWEGPELNEQPNPATIATLRAFADRLDSEDARAESVVAALMATPPESWTSQAESHPEWLTVGMVRKLISAAGQAIQTMPRDAVALARVATSIADRLEDGKYESQVIAKHRAGAWRTYAYTLYYAGHFATGWEAIEVAQKALSGVPLGDYDAARAGIVRAYLLRSLENTGAAYDDARKSAAVFAAFGDASRSTVAAFAYAYVLLKEQHYRAALDVYEQQLSSTTDREMLGLLHLNIGFCHRELGEFDTALQQYQIALDAFEEANSISSATRVRWNIAGVLLAAGRLNDAYPRLLAARDALTSLGMHAEAMLARLELAEVLLAQERYAEIEPLCREVMSYFEEAGVAYGRHAMTALAYMQEATRARKATVELVRHVRNYVMRLPEQPNLLFAYPPS